MIELKYEAVGHTCRTDCPYKQHTTGSVYFYKIGSTSCQKCEYHISKNSRKRIVKCGYTKGFNRNGANS